jgi:uncharacterized protein (DUF433 family)
MGTDPLLERIVIDPEIAIGTPTIRGTPIAVAFLLELMAGGMTPEEVLADYPQLTADDIRAALAGAARRDGGSFVDVA